MARHACIRPIALSRGRFSTKALAKHASARRPLARSSRPISPDAVSRLKLSCMELLVAAVESKEFREGEGLVRLREEVTNLFFKKLTTAQQVGGGRERMAGAGRRLLGPFPVALI